MRKYILKEIIEEDDTPAGRWWDFSIQALIVISLISFTVSTLPNLSPRTMQLLWFIELITIVIFTAEYGVAAMGSR